MLAWKASAHWLRGEADACAESAARALAIATAAGDPQSLAAAHTVQAMLAALDGDRGANDAHYLRALEHATRGGRPAPDHPHPHEPRLAPRRGGLVRGGARRARDRAPARRRRRLRVLPGARAHEPRARRASGSASSRRRSPTSRRRSAIFQRMGSRMVGYALYKLGEVRRARGELALARADYEEAVALAEQAATSRGSCRRSPGSRACSPTRSRRRPRELAERAVAHGPGMGYVGALLAVGARRARARGPRSGRGRRPRDAAAAARGRGATGPGSPRRSSCRRLPSTAPDVGARRGSRRRSRSGARSAIRSARRAPSSRSARARPGDGRAGGSTPTERLRALGARGLATDAASLRRRADREARPAGRDAHARRVPRAPRRRRRSRSPSGSRRRRATCSRS